MTFINSLRLFGSNWTKSLKFVLYYLVIWGVSFLLLLPNFFAFKSLLTSNFESINATASFGVFKGSLGENIYNLMHNGMSFVVDVFNSNLGLAIYGVFVIFLLMPFLINVGKYTLNEMMYSYMTSKSKIGFFNALVRGLKKSVVFALCISLTNILFVATTGAILYGISFINNPTFITYFLPLTVYIVLVLTFSLYQVAVLGWSSATIVFDCNIFCAYRKSVKAVKRHFWATLATTTLYFAIFWAFMLIFGIYTFIVLVPIMSALLCIYDMVVFFASQGMRFYINETQILTPKKLEEVDNINKTAYIL